MKDCRGYALITGVAGGIGSALARAFLAAGYSVIGTDRDSDASAEQGYDLIPIDLEEVCKHPQIAEDFRSSVLKITRNRGLSAIINNAAVQILGGVQSLSVDDFKRTLEINVVAPFVLAKLFSDELTLVRGSILNIGSIHSRLTKKGFLAYSTSKGALSSLTRAMALDLAPHIRVNCIEPAAIDTDMLRDGFSGDPKGYALLKEYHPQSEIGTPAQVALLALKIVDADVPFLNGACIAMDGGISGRLHDPH